MNKQSNKAKKSLVDDYNKLKPRETKYFKSNEDVLKGPKNWIPVRRFYFSEVQPIIEDEIRVVNNRSEKYDTYDILFEYLVIRSVTILERRLKHYCNIFVEEFPERAELLLKNRDKKQNLSVQVISTYTFSNLDDIKHVFSTLLDKDYFQLLRHRSEEHKSSIGYEGDHLRRASPLFKKWGMFEQLMKLRNKLVHENKHIKIKSKKVKKNLLNTIYEVIYLTDSEQLEFPYREDEFSEIRPRY